MTLPVASIATGTPVAWPLPLQPSTGTSETGFANLLSQSWNDTQAITQRAQTSIEQNLVSSDLSMVETFTAMREADVALRLMMQIRNKLVDAYQELQQLRF